MATISGFGGITPPDRSKSNTGPKQTEANVDPQVGTDGVEFQFKASPEAPAAWYDSKSKTLNYSASEKPNELVELRERAHVTTPSSPSVPVTLTMDDGLFGVSSISNNASADKVGLGAFTNGLGSTSLIGLSGRELASLDPRKQNS